jgi:multidrug efflux pump subunit AcrA (membrane-fusion protein)
LIEEIQMTNRLMTAILASLCVVPIACTSSGQTNPHLEKSVRARTAVIEFTTVPNQFQAPGTIRARTRTVLSSKVVGQILSVPVREGDRVKAGQALAEIDNRESAAQLRRAQAAAAEAERGLEEADRTIQAAEAALHAAEANRDLAASTRKRYDLLRERRSVSPQEYDEIETKYRAADLDVNRLENTLAAARARRSQIAARIEQAEAEVQAVQVMLGYSRLIAPFDGIVAERHAEPGMLASPGMPLIALEDDRTYELEVAVEESNTAKIRAGQSVHIEIDALADVPLNGKVREIVPSSDPETRTHTVKLQITTALPQGQILRSGFFGRAFFPLGDRDALIVPESALSRRGQLEGVYIVENDAAVLRLVKTGKRYEQGIEVLSGLTPGTKILTAPPRDVSDGARIIDETSARSMP